MIENWDGTWESTRILVSVKGGLKGCKNPSSKVSTNPSIFVSKGGILHTSEAMHSLIFSSFDGLFGDEGDEKPILGSNPNVRLKPLMDLYSHNEILGWILNKF